MKGYPLKTEKIYCGSDKSQNQSWLKCTINPDKLMEHIQEFKGKQIC